MRWATARALKAMWDAMSEEQQVEWYRKQQAIPVGSKRKYDFVEYNDASTKESLNQRLAIDGFMPWKKFKLEGLIESKTLRELELEWKALVEDPLVGAIWERGQWLVPEFQGVQLMSGTRESQSSTLSRGSQITSQEQLQGMIEAGDLQRNAFNAQCTGAIVPPPTNTPVVDATSADQPQVRPPADILGKVIMKEVT